MRIWENRTDLDSDSFQKNFTDSDPKRIRTISKEFNGTSQNLNISMADIAIASKLLYFGNVFGYIRNLPQNYEKILEIFCNSENKIVSI